MTVSISGTNGVTFPDGSLQAADHHTNNYNKGVQKNNKLGMKNICWSKQNKKWWVQVMANGKRVVSLMFDDLELAQLVAHEARDKFHGSFANHGVNKR